MRCSYFVTRPSGSQKLAVRYLQSIIILLKNVGIGRDNYIISKLYYNGRTQLVPQLYRKYLLDLKIQMYKNLEFIVHEKNMK